MESKCTPEEIRATLDAILATPAFARSESISWLLEHVVTTALEGREQTLKEYNLGVDVFRRGEDFDLRLDNIVRVQVRKLRQRLAAYYASARSGVRIDLPTGSYVPVFQRMEAAPESAVSVPAEPGSRGRSLRLGRWGTAAAAALAGFLAGFICANRLARPADTGAAPRVAVSLTPPAPAGDDPEEVQAGALVSQIVRARLSRMAGLRIVNSSPIRGFTITGSTRRTGNRIALQLSLRGDAEQRGRGLRCSVTAEDEIAEAQALAVMLAERMVADVRNLLEGTPRTGPAWDPAPSDFDASADFAARGNMASNGSWSYGWERDLRGPFQPYSRPFRVQYWGTEVTGWSQSGEGPQNGDHCCPFVAKNTSGHDLFAQSSRSRRTSCGSIPDRTASSASCAGRVELWAGMR
jgi:hypothetical protein